LIVTQADCVPANLTSSKNSRQTNELDGHQTFTTACMGAAVAAHHVVQFEVKSRGWE
jgi:hypothetical protein